MTKRFQAFMNMVYSLLNFFIKNANKISKDTIVKKTLDLITDKTKLVKHFNDIQNRDTRGITIDKKESKKQLADAILLVSSILRTFAFDTKNNTLYKAVDDTKSVLVRMGDTVLLRYARTVRDYAEKYADKLEPYDFKPETLTSLDEEIVNYSDWMTKPLEAASEKVVATKEINTNVSEIRSLIRGNLNNAMFKYAFTDMPFYKEYLSIKEIIDPASHRKNLLIEVLHEETKEGVANVAVTIIRTKAVADLANTVKKLTNKEGRVGFSRLEPGKFTARFEKHGFDTLEVTFYINVNEITTLKVEIRQTE